MDFEMKSVAVQGLWHLGTVTSVCLASLGLNIVGFSYDETEVDQAKLLKFPVYEPGLKELADSAIQQGNLRFSSSVGDLEKVDALWIAYDTPVDDQDRADINFVVKNTLKSMAFLRDNCFVVISSQLPVGTISAISELARSAYPTKSFKFISVPENLRLGNAVDIFLNPDRIVVGASPENYENFIKLIAPLAKKCINVSIESAELTKHAINTFLALSVVYANEIAAIAEMVGADAHEVAACLKSESRIGPKAYLKPGLAFGGGTLARDVQFLKNISVKNQHHEYIFSAIKDSNDSHKGWVLNHVTNLFGENLKGHTFKILGLTYKPETNTIRRSTSVDLCNELLAKGARLVVHDPMATNLPDTWDGKVERIDSPGGLGKVNSAIDTVLLLTDWPEYKNLQRNNFEKYEELKFVIDPKQHLLNFKDDDRVNYFSIGFIRKI